MIFNSIDFILFFFIVTVLYYFIPNHYRWILLCLAGSLFYASFAPAYLILVYGIILVSYLGGIWIEKSSGQKRKSILAGGLILLFAPLLAYKYFDFFQANMISLANLIHWNYPGHLLKLILPIGLSFYTFQAISYLVEIYWGKQSPERHLGIYSLFILFFPQLLAGPIARPQTFLPQLRADHAFNGQNISDGLKLMLWGYFKKMVIADRLAIVVNYAYSHIPTSSGWTLLITAVFFSFQIYCDFSAYSDIAIGSAQVLGFKLMDNFKRPYFSKSIGEFWNRWHISLSSWLRDYVYIPLGGSRVAQWKWARNILITFLASGLWHGANWTFVVWGLLNGIYITFSRYTEKPRKWLASLIRLDRHPLWHKAFKVFFTFTLITLSWIFFRADSLHQAIVILQKIDYAVLLWLMHPTLPDSAAYRILISQMGIGIYDLAVILAGLVVLEGVHLLERQSEMRHLLNNRPVYFRWAIYYAVILAIALFGVYHSQAEFIYFKF